jgi:hypothetical protein
MLPDHPTSPKDFAASVPTVVGERIEGSEREIVTIVWRAEVLNSRLRRRNESAENGP